MTENTADTAEVENTTTDTETAAADAEDTTATEDGAPEDGAPEDDQDDGDDRDDISRARYQAKKYRARLREAETERDQLRADLAAQRRAVIDWRASNAIDGAVDPQLLDAAGINIADLLDDTGHLDMTAVDKFIDETAVKFRVQRAVKPNPQQGNPSQAPAPPRLADVFAPKGR